MIPMHEFLVQTLTILRDHRGWAGPLLGIGAAFEAIVIVGAFTPLTPLLVMVGAAIAAGIFSPAILVWTMVGCGLGNWISFEIGDAARRHDRGHAWISPRAKHGADRLFSRYGPAAVIAGRFLGPLASAVPFLAGWAEMPRRRFLAANLATSLVWPICMAAIGYFGAKALAPW